MHRGVAVLLVALVATGCGTQPAVDPEGQDLVTCVGPPFAARVFELPADATKDQSSEGKTFRELLQSGPFQAYSQIGAWRVLGRTDVEVAFGAGDPPVLHGYVVLRRFGESWRYDQSGSGCIVRPYRPGRILARWGLDPAGEEVSPASRSLELIVNDPQCASGVGPEERLDDPVVEVSETAVTITFTSRPRSGDDECPSHPPEYRRVTLPEALGVRQLLDGGIYPPQPPCRIDGNDCANDVDLVGS